jgi:hypothetical protein
LIANVASKKTVAAEHAVRETETVKLISHLLRKRMVCRKTGGSGICPKTSLSQNWAASKNRIETFDGNFQRSSKCHFKTMN